MIEKILFTLHVYFIEVLRLILKNMNFSWNSSRAQILIERIFIFCATLSIFVQKTMIMKYVVLSFKAIAEIIDRERLNKMFTMQSFRSFDRMIEVSGVELISFGEHFIQVLSIYFIFVFFASDWTTFFSTGYGAAIGTLRGKKIRFAPINIVQNRIFSTYVLSHKWIPSRQNRWF